MATEAIFQGACEFLIIESEVRMLPHVKAERMHRQREDC